jgi:hypothetical protein
MVKKLKQSLVPEGVNYDEWIINASVKDLVAETQFRMERLNKVLKDKPKKKKNA